ncbi:MAG: proteasome subunit beta [Ilumatobacteraceae bacterium]|nr:proteasome subunit beta [Ilumatobacteraceae bacterium]
MAMPVFTPGDDPGADFPMLLQRSGYGPVNLPPGSTIESPHATTCVAVRYDNGVVMAGDRRATSGHLISHRTMEKVVQADRHSGVAIAGAAGPAVDMIRLFQVQLEYYEKVQGSALSLEGKANQLASMVRANIPGAMQGMGVVPIFAGYDIRRSVGRLWAYDMLGGRYEERDHVATGSGSLHASTVMKVGYRSNLTRDEAVELVARSLWEAADSDSATGGPDMVRGIFPVVATIDSDGWMLVADNELADRYRTIISQVEGSTS